MIKYQITDPKQFSKENLEKSFKHHSPDMVCFRDKSSQNKNESAKLFIEICKKFNIKKILINEDIESALDLKADGIHLTSKQFNKIAYCKEKSLFVIISCHTLEEIETAQRLGADTVTYSPIFFTPGKGKPKGIEALKEAVDRFEIDIIALGGIITVEQIDMIEKSGAKGFASIRYFVDS